MVEMTTDEKLWSLGLHEDNLFHTRIQIFLTAHALLLAPVGFLVSRDEFPRGFLIGLAILGVMLGLVWLVVQMRSRTVIQRIERQLDSDPVFRSAFPVKGDSYWTQTLILAALLPTLVVLAWIALVLAFIFSWV